MLLRLGEFSSEMVSIQVELRKLLSKWKDNWGEDFHTLSEVAFASLEKDSKLKYGPIDRYDGSPYSAG